MNFSFYSEKFQSKTAAAVGTFASSTLAWKLQSVSICFVSVVSYNPSEMNQWNQDQSADTQN